MCDSWNFIVWNKIEKKKMKWKNVTLSHAGTRDSLFFHLHSLCRNCTIIMEFFCGLCLSFSPREWKASLQQRQITVLFFHYLSAAPMSQSSDDNSLIFNFLIKNSGMAPPHNWNSVERTVYAMGWGCNVAIFIFLSAFRLLWIS